VAYAVSRRVGPAVVRNRVRRRLRHALAAHRDLLVADGAYLVIPRPGLAEIPHAELRALVADVLRAATASSGRPAADVGVLRAVAEPPGHGSDGAER
jgi:ribonuclease P protein component